MSSTESLNPENVRVGKTLKAFREKSGLTLTQVGYAVEKSYSYLSNIENGRKPLTPVLLARLASLYAVPQAAIVRADLFVTRSDTAA